MVENVLRAYRLAHPLPISHLSPVTCQLCHAIYPETITGLKTIANEMLFSSAGGAVQHTSSTTIANDAHNVIHAGTDMAAEDDANLRFGSWYGIGWYPTIKDQKVERGKNAMWLNVRNGHLYVAGGYHVKTDGLPVPQSRRQP